MTKVDELKWWGFFRESPEDTEEDGLVEWRQRALDEDILAKLLNLILKKTKTIYY